MAIVTSVLTAGSNNHLTTSEEANGVYTDFVGQGIVGSVGNTSGVAPNTGGFAVNAQGTPDATVAVSSGVAYVTGTPTSQNSQTFRVKNSASTNVTISANASGSTKYDWVYIKLDATNLNTPNTAGDNVATIVTSRSSSASADDGTPPTYGYNIAVVTVANGFSTITNANIADKRAQVILATGSSNPAGGWTATSAPTTITALGNRSYTVLYPSVDLTGSLFNGMRQKFTRTVTAPTQCTSLNGTTQYYSKTSPAGTTFTDDFNAAAWVKLSSYQAGVIISRYNGTSGWSLEVNASGQVILIGYNGGAANFSQVLSYRSLPLNKWVHVAAQLDMSAFTATTTTSYIMIDGLDVPAAVSRGGTNPTALIQAGDLNVGAKNAGTFFAGKIAQVWYSSAKITQATILTYISQTVAGSETSFVSAYSFNNTINDLNANANNLTANGSAVATNLDTPFTQTVTGVTTGTTNYGVITDVVYSTNTTVTIQLPEGGTLPTSGGISGASYSSQKTPFGFPAQKSKWRIETIYMASETVSFGAINTWYASNFKITVPVGDWVLGYQAEFNLNSTVSGTRQGNFTLTDSVPTNAVFSQPLTSFLFGATGTDMFGLINKVIPYTVSSATLNTVYGSVGSATGTEIYKIRGDVAPSMLVAELSYV